MLMISDAIDMPRSSAPPRFTLFDRMFPRKDRSSGTLPNDPLFGRNRIFFACVIHMQSQCDMGARDVGRHIVTTSTPTLVVTQRGFETRTPYWTLEGSACRSREHLRTRQLGAVYATGWKQQSCLHEAGMWRLTFRNSAV